MDSWNKISRQNYSHHPGGDQAGPEQGLQVPVRVHPGQAGQEGGGWEGGEADEASDLPRLLSNHSKRTQNSVWWSNHQCNRTTTRQKQKMCNTVNSKIHFSIFITNLVHTKVQTTEDIIIFTKLQPFRWILFVCWNVVNILHVYWKVFGCVVSLYAFL